MELVVKKETYTVWKKRNGKYAVRNEKRAFLNGEQKLEVLVKEGILKAMPKKAEEAPAETAEA